MKLILVSLVLAWLSACASTNKLATCDGANKRPINQQQSAAPASIANASCGGAE